MKVYEKPLFRWIEIRPEERLAGSPCTAGQGNKDCGAGTAPSNGNPVP